MSYLRHPPLFVGISLLLLLSGLYLIGANTTTQEVVFVDSEKLYSQSVINRVQLVEQYGDELTSWCALELSSNAEQIASFTETSVNKHLWSRYYDALDKCSTGDDPLRSSAFLQESIYILFAAYK